VAAEREPFLGSGQAVEHCGGGAGEQALGRAVARRLPDRLWRKAKQHDRRPGPAVGRGLRRQEHLDADFGVAADHARAVAARRPHRGVEPVGVVGRDDQPREPQPKRFGEGVDDLRGSDEHRWHLLAVRKVSWSWVSAAREIAYSDKVHLTVARPDAAFPATVPGRGVSSAA